MICNCLFCFWGGIGSGGWLMSGGLCGYREDFCFVGGLGYKIFSRLRKTCIKEGVIKVV